VASPLGVQNMILGVVSQTEFPRENSGCNTGYISRYTFINDKSQRRSFTPIDKVLITIIAGIFRI